MENQQHSQIMLILGQLKETGDGINRRLDVLNGTVAKHEVRLGNVDVMNAQTTISQQQIMEKIKDLQVINKDKENTKNKWVDRTIWSIVIPAVTFIIILVLTKLGILNI